MKKVSLFLMFMLLGVATIFAQVIEGEAAMTQGTNNSFSIELRSTNKKDVTKAWTKYLKAYKGKIKEDKKSGQIFADNCTISGMSSNTVDIYSTVTQSGSDNTLRVWFDLGGAYLSSEMHADKVPVAQQLITDFAESVSQAMVEEDLKNQEKILSDLTKSQKDLENKKEKLEGDIKDYEQKIADAKNEIASNLEAQISKQAEITAQQKVVDAVKATLAKFNK